jgi:GTP cyclohydrolase II
MRLITKNPKKISFFEKCGIEIVERIPAITKTNKFNENYLKTKKEELGHLL